MPNLLKLFLYGVLGTGALFASSYSLGTFFAGQADENLDATLFTIRLVDRFVNDHGRWPRSWSELEKTAAPPPQTFQWPAESAELQEQVKIDFRADLSRIVSEEPRRFRAIRPMGATHPYRESSEVRSLLKTIRDKVGNGKAD